MEMLYFPGIPRQRSWVSGVSAVDYLAAINTSGFIIKGKAMPIMRARPPRTTEVIPQHLNFAAFVFAQQHIFIYL
jgi:hypothetical protein